MVTGTEKEHDYVTARERLAAIQAHLDANGHVLLVTYTQARLYKKKHRNLFTATDIDLFVQHGKRKECLNLSVLKFSRTS